MLSHFPSYPPSFRSTPPLSSIHITFAPSRPCISRSPSILDEISTLKTRIQELEKDLRMSREETDEAVELLELERVRSSAKELEGFRDELKSRREMEEEEEQKQQEEPSTTEEPDKDAQELENRIAELEEGKRGVELALGRKERECEALRKTLKMFTMDNGGFQHEENPGVKRSPRIRRSRSVDAISTIHQRVEEDVDVEEDEESVVMVSRPSSPSVVERTIVVGSPSSGGSDFVVV